MASGSTKTDVDNVAASSGRRRSDEPRERHGGPWRPRSRYGGWQAADRGRRGTVRGRPGDLYSHPDLTRERALHVFNGVLSERLEIREFVHVDNAKRTQVFRCKRIPSPAQYLNSLRDCVNLVTKRQDQGVDYAVTKDSPTYAIGPGKITNYRQTSGWPRHEQADELGSFVVYSFTDGPAKDKYVYLAENITLNPDLKVGSKDRRADGDRDAASADSTHPPIEAQEVVERPGSHDSEGGQTVDARVTSSS